MAFKTRVEDFEVLPEDTYDAIFVDIEEADSERGEYWKWTFEILRDGEEPFRLTANSSAKLTRATKGGQWAAAIQGRLIESGGDFDFAAIQGKPCRLLLSVEDTDRGEFNRVEKVMAPSPGQQQRQPVPVSQAPDDALF